MDIRINGPLVGRWPFEYAGFAYDLTPDLKFGSVRNVLVVIVQTTRESGKIRLVARSEGLADTIIEIDSQPNP